MKAECIYSPVINFAMQQNHVPLIRKLALQNDGNTTLEEVRIEIEADPSFASAKIIHAGSLAPEESVAWTDIQLPLSARYLSELTERISGHILLKVFAGETMLYHTPYNIQLLAFDQWNGFAVLPQLLAAFITPNHPQLAPIIRRASGILQSWTGDPSFNEYQSRNPDRVRKQMAALYEAIAERGIVYCSAPASFEETGQRIRMCDTLFSAGIGNCLDLSLLYASCLEAVGIHPLLVLIKGHAFAGAWLTEECFADPVNDDVALLSKRIAEGIHEIALVEATCLNAGNATPFDEAARQANSKLGNEDFIGFIDVKRTRFSGIKPLPVRTRTENGWQLGEEITTRNHNAPVAIQREKPILTEGKTEWSKQQLWERKLLDLTLRNALLNLRFSRSAVQFIGLNISHLEDALSRGEELQMLPKPNDWDNTLRSTGMYQSLHQTDAIADLVQHQFTQKRIHAHLPQNELEGRLVNLYRSSRTALEENGASTLYMALGVLKWYETERSEKAHYAPILLVPVEILRKTSQKGFVVRSREEEMQVNITLLEMLRQDFGISIGGLDSLPKDENGVDVKAVLNVFRQSIMAQSRWDVEEHCFLATFSFSKFILWNDIHHHADDLAKHKIVGSLISGTLQWQPTAETGLQHTDEVLHPASVALPVSSDSSQLKAIIASAQNESFVLHGPPGTGKSQTITNIIANALYNGKKVLFVSAKKAALDVVHQRLQNIGIGSFCLELHSNKAKKSAVLSQLETATETVKKASPQQFSAEAERLFSLRNELNGYVNAVHAKGKAGVSLSQVLHEYSALPEESTPISFSTDDVKDLTPDKLVQWNDLAEEIKAAGEGVGGVYHHPLTAIQTTEYLQPLKAEVKQILEGYQHNVKQGSLLQSDVARTLQIQTTIATKQQAVLLRDMCSLLISLPDVPASLFGVENGEENLPEIIAAAEHGIKRNALRDHLRQSFTDSLLEIDAAPLLQRWTEASGKWLVPRWWQQNAILKQLSVYSLNGPVKKEEAANLLQTLIAYRKEQQAIERATSLPRMLGFLWQEGEADWNKIIVICNALLALNRQYFLLHQSPLSDAWRKAFSQGFYHGSKSYLSSFYSSLEQYITCFHQIEFAEDRLQRALHIDFTKTNAGSTDWWQTVFSNANKWLQHIEELRDWTAWRRVRSAALEAGLHRLITQYENGGVPTETLLFSFKKGVYKALADSIISGEPALSSFRHHLFEEKIRKFREVSRRFEQLTREELYARLAANIRPFAQEAAQSSEVGILQKAIRNKGRGLSIRKLFESIPTLLPMLTPCMLMSPISVAQYFDSSSEKFDLLVFDEASQLPTCEAVAAIARAKNIIVVGDPNQMPPTSFFATNNTDEENIDKEDLESILDDCLALSMPEHHLRWHYRSKHESLIAFSNAKYYNNKLLTFPSPDDIVSKVSYVHVPGWYDKGATRQNRFEAEAIVKEVLYRLQHERFSKQSIGIVTFSLAQQNLVEDLLTEAFAKYPDLEKMALQSDEPIFIKNLENVQGDERDVILFSIGYGPDETGKVSLNFGPVNREGGWRRLNVAISRARYEMKVFATLKAEQINLLRTSSEGIAGLKSFLEFAQKGKSALPLSPLEKPVINGSFEENLAQQIRNQGYEVHTHVGSSSYTIDIAVVHPQKEKEYVLGIVCDGDAYYSAGTARDREIVQPDVLASLGWNLYKVWLADWWENPEKTIANIMAAIKQAETKPLSEDMLPETEAQQEHDNTERILNSLAAVNSSSHTETDVTQTVYQTAVLPQKTGASTEEFLLPSNRNIITAQIIQVIRAEAPISKNLLSKRILNAWQVGRMGNRISAYLDALLNDLQLAQTQQNGLVFYWNAEQNALTYNEFRTAVSDGQKRDAEDIPAEEIASAVRLVLHNQLGLLQTDLIKETAKLFGFARIGSNVETAMTSGIRKAIDKGFAKEEGGRIVYVAG